ncbi:MAG TPA: tetratricopeptide repeat protein [Terracidiphilus sp.]
MKKALAVFLLCAALLPLSAEVPKDGLALADAALQSGEADRALSLLSAMPESADVHNLRCRTYFALGRWDEAASECDQAVRLNGGSSIDHLWLGRALGEKADNASFLAAFNLAKRARSEFEQAVTLDSRNGEALTDLGEFYTSAPGVVGGGVDKAQTLVTPLQNVDPARAHILLARIAESRKDLGTAEREFKTAATSSEHPAFAWMTLASFYRKHERWDDMEAAVDSGYRAAQHDRRAGVALYNGASVLIRGKRNLALAKKMLEDYLANYPRTEEGPAFEAYTRLAKVNAQLGDRNSAWQARAEALKLAHDYRPALGLKF